MKALVIGAVVLGSVAPVAAAPRWCKGFKGTDQVFPEQIKDGLETYKQTKDVTDLPRIAVLSCGAADARGATEILAAWEKATGLAEADAIASLQARVSPTWDADHAALCSALEVPDGQDQKHVMAKARSVLFGCADSDRDDPSWMSRSDNRLYELLPLLDSGADRDEVVRLAWVLGEVRHMLNPGESGPVIANYALAQFDIKALDDEAARRQLAAAPLQGNRYARIVLAESSAWTRMQIDRVEAAVAKKTQDATWKNLLVTVPQKAYAEWNAAAAAHKDVLTHGASADCATLRGDVVAMIKQANKGDLVEIEGKLNDNPLAGVMLARYVDCLGDSDDETDRSVRKAARILAGAVPEIGGPRQAAYVATRTALASLPGGKRHAPFDAWHDLSEPDPPRYRNDGETMGTLSSGVIKTVKPAKKGDLAVTFVHDTYRYTVVECKETSKIDRVLPDGKVEYRKACHDAGTAVADKAPAPMTVPASCKAGVAAGRFAFEWDGLPWLIYADKSRKKVVAAYCLPFP